MINSANLYIIIAIATVFVFAMYFFMFYRKDREHTRSLEERRMQLEQERADRMEALEQERMKRSIEETARAAYERERLEHRLYENQEALLQSSCSLTSVVFVYKVPIA